MNIQEELTCKFCNQIYTDPVSLNCGHNICKKHLDDLFANSNSKPSCPSCNSDILYSTFKVNEALKKIIEIQLHKVKPEPGYENLMQSLRNQLKRLETIRTDPEFLFSELRSRIEFDREMLKSQIDNLANEQLNELNKYEIKLKTEPANAADKNRKLSFEDDVDFKQPARKKAKTATPTVSWIEF